MKTVAIGCGGVFVLSAVLMGALMAGSDAGEPKALPSAAECAATFDLRFVDAQDAIKEFRARFAAGEAIYDPSKYQKRYLESMSCSEHDHRERVNLQLLPFPITDTEEQTAVWRAELIECYRSTLPRCRKTQRVIEENHRISQPPAKAASHAP